MGRIKNTINPFLNKFSTFEKCAKILQCRKAQFKLSSHLTLFHFGLKPKERRKEGRSEVITIYPRAKQAPDLTRKLDSKRKKAFGLVKLNHQG